MANESVTVTQTLDQVTVVSEGPVGLNAGGTISGALNVGAEGNGHDVKFFGDGTGKYMQWDADTDKLFINGELEVNGSATTFNSTVVTIDDPVFTLGGQEGSPLTGNDSKDRGIEFFYNDGAAKRGFMGYDDSADAFTFLTSASNSNEIFSGTEATIHAGTVKTPTIGTQSGNLTLAPAGTYINFTGKRLYGSNVGLGYQLNAVSAQYVALGTGIDSPTASLSRTANGTIAVGNGTQNDASGTLVLAETHFGSSDMRIRNSSNRMIFSTGGSDGVAIGSTGNLGVGVVSPAFPLHINGATTATLAIQCNGNNAEGSKIRLIEGSANFQGGFIHYDGSANALNIGVHENNNSTLSEDVNAITIPRDTGRVTVQGSSTTNFKIETPAGSGSGYIDTLMGNTPKLRMYQSSGNRLEINPGDGNINRFNSSNAALDFSLATNGGKVGIGTTSPAGELEVQGTGDLLYLRETGREAATITGQGNGSGSQMIFKTHSGSALSEAMRILPSGNVGIGTTAVDYRLDIGGTTPSTSNTLRMVQANGGTAIRFGAGGGSNDVTLLRVDGNDAAALSRGETDSSNFGFSLKYMGSRSGNANSLSIFSDNQAAASQVEAITIFQDGKVGIGTTSPSALLDVAGPIFAGTPQRLSLGGHQDTFTGSFSIISQNDHGDFSFASNLRVDSDRNFTTVNNHSTMAGGAMVIAGNGNSFGTNSIYFLSQPSGSTTAGTEVDEAGARMIIKNDGNVGIGTTSPAALLHLSHATAPTFRLSRTGTGQVWEQSIDSSGRLLIREAASEGGTQYTRVAIDDDGNVGIGTGGPTSLLHIEGATPTVNINGTSSTGPVVQLSGTFCSWTIENQYAGGANNDMFRIRNSALSADALVINRGNNKVGIGNTNPIYALDVTGGIRFTSSSVADGDLTFSDGKKANFGNSTDFQIKHDGDGHNKLTSLNGDIRFYTNSAERLRIDDSSGLLRVFGDLQVDGTTTTVNSTTVTIDDPILTLGGDTAPASDDNKDRGIEFRYYDGSAKIGFMGWDDSAGGFTFLKGATNSSEVFSGTAADLATGAISAGGHINLNDNQLQNVGVLQGTASGGLLIKHGDGNFAIVGNTSGKLDLRHAGSVKLETSSTGIEVTGGITAGGTIRSEATGGSVFTDLKSDQIFSSGAFDLVVGTNNKLHFRTDDTRRMTISGDGHVGIGTSSPSANSAKTTLHIDGTSQGAAIRMSQSGNSGLIRYDNTAGLQIGTIASKDVILEAGDTEFLRLDAGEDQGKFRKHMRFDDDVQARFGTHTDASIRHDDSDWFLQCGKGDAYFQNLESGKDIILRVNSGSGAEEYLKLDSSAGNTLFSKDAKFSDDVMLGVGDASDLRLKHNGTDSFIQNLNGHLNIINYSDTSDIVLATDDGSGGTTDYLQIDGGAQIIQVKQDLYALDNIKLRAGNAGDLEISHNGSNSNISNATGNLQIINNANNQDIRLICDDGSDGTATYITLDGSQGFTTLQKHLTADDNVNIQAGTDGDLRIFFDGSNGNINNVTGDLILSNGANDRKIFVRGDDGSGGVTSYMTVDGYLGFTTLQKKIRAEDTVRAEFGSDGDLVIEHTGSNAQIGNLTGDITITQLAAGADIRLAANDGSGSQTDYLRLDGSAASGGDVYTVFPDRSHASFGDGRDLDLHHDSGNSYIANSTGHLYLRNSAYAKDIILQSDAGGAGLATYLTIDSSREEVVANKPLIQTPGTVEPANNGELGFRVINNTSIKLEYKGSDGTVRGTTLTLS